MIAWFMGCVYAIFLVLCAAAVEFMLAKYVHHEPMNNDRFLFTFIFVVACRVGEFIFKDMK